MRKYLLLLFTFFFVSFQAQEICAFDQVQKELEEKNPENKRRRELAEERLRKTDITAYLEKIGATTSRSEGYTGTIYEIPVVVHVIESSTGSGASVTDAEITTWIENANKMYATTYGGDFYAEGDGADDGTVIPFKLVLAKRNPQCEATTGIIRYSGDGLTGYATYGMNNSGNQGASSGAILGLAPHWPEGAYYNMYIVTGFDGNFSNWGLMGYAGFPTNADSSYHTFMKVPVVTKTDDDTLAHEFGHSLGLHHPFNGANSSGGECPTNDNCSTDNDLVCDTEPTQSFLGVATPSNTDTNPCTSANYQGVQYNVMNYTYSSRKFTPGQRDRALVMFMQNRGSLVTSLGGTEPSASQGGELTSLTCEVTNVAHVGNYGFGPTKVVLGTINNPSASGSGADFYVDYTTQTCLNSAFSTEIPDNTPSTILISIANHYDHHIKAWIDFNNDGNFDNSEVIADNQNAAKGQEHSFSFTPPEDAVKNTNLRMRVSADWGYSLSPCGQYAYGQAEDYMVKITTTLNVAEVNQTDFTVVYNQSDNTLNLFNTKEKFGNYNIFDFSGKLIQSGDSDTRSIKLNTIPKGGYVLQFEYQGEEISHKFLK